MTSELDSAENAAAARIRCSAVPLSLASFSGETEIATNRRPTSVPATLAQPAKKL
jgi:hypothetical protein